MISLHDIEEIYKKCASLINDANKITFLTGAGVETDSGIPDFRSNTGLYNKIPENTFEINHFKMHPAEVYSIISKYFLDAKPNNIHKMIADLEKTKEVNVITQNISPLHQESGSTNVIQVHGTIGSGICLHCGAKYKPLYYNDYHCEKCGGIVKPNVVFFGENVHQYQECINIMKQTDLLIVLGTSMVVQPVASLPHHLNVNTTPIIVINKDETYLDNSRMATSIHDDIEKSLKNIFKYL